MIIAQQLDRGVGFFLSESPGIAGSCRCCHSRRSSTGPDRSCNRRFPPAGPMVPQHEPGYQPAGWRMKPSDSLQEQKGDTTIE